MDIAFNRSVFSVFSKTIEQRHHDIRAEFSRFAGLESLCALRGRRSPGNRLRASIS